MIQFLRKTKHRSAVEFLEAPDIKKRIAEIVPKLPFEYINTDLISCFRSLGASTRAIARIWSFPRIWQLALKEKPHYIIEVISEKYDRMDPSQKDKVLIHELMHIPKGFSGALVPHRNRGRHINSRNVDTIYREFLKAQTTNNKDD